MSNAIFIFTFGPIQPFIAEARRTSDLFSGSQILVNLSRKVVNSIEDQKGSLIFPASNIEDVPNKIAAIVAWDQVQEIARNAEKAFFDEWEKIADTALVYLKTKNPVIDEVYEQIWQRQVGYIQQDGSWKNPFWEVYWSAAKLDHDEDYVQAYHKAEQSLNARKRCRNFVQSFEDGIKDSLSGKRSALRNAEGDARRYWQELQKELIAPDLRPSEKLDAIGAIKRFSSISQKGLFPSTSSIASRLFLEKAYKYDELLSYKQKVDQLELFSVDDSNPHWPYDGDLLYIDSITRSYLKQNYNVDIAESKLSDVKEYLAKLYKSMESKPPLYYAILVMDGDSMGEKVNQCLEEKNPKAAHMEFSNRLGEFASKVAGIVSQFSGNTVYSGGDDVLALIPLANVFQAYQNLAQEFRNEISGCTASAGIAVVHHTFPLNTALKEARIAEHAAKQMPNKDSICFRVLKRSGETVQIASPRQEAEENFDLLCKYYQIAEESVDGLLSGRFGYDVLNSSRDLIEIDEKFESELKRLINRHRDKQYPNPLSAEYAKQLCDWGKLMPGKTEELANWLIFSRFVVMGGEE